MPSSCPTRPPDSPPTSLRPDRISDMPSPILWPAEPKFASGAEQRVWTALKEQLGEKDLLISNQRFTDMNRDYELDIAVAFHGLGVVVLEIKGGKVWVENGLSL